MGEHLSDAVDSVLRWLNSASLAPVSFEVAGTSTAERVRLAALGSLVYATFLRRDLGAHLPALEQHVALKGWVAPSILAPLEVVQAMEACVELDPETALAAIYSGAVSSANRRRLGTFFTPSAEVEEMLAGCERVGMSPRTVIDVGAGVGIFTLAAHRRWTDADVLGVDINPVTLGLLGLLAASTNALSSGERPGVRLVLDDFVEFVQRGFSSLPGPRLILGNPPYTRMQLLPSSDRARLLKAAEPLCGSRASLSAIITAISLKHLEPADGLALLLPAQWLESDYARPLRERIWSETRRPVELHMFRADLFSDAQVDAVSLLVGPQQPTEASFLTSNEAEEHRVRHLRGFDSPDTWRHLFRGTSGGATPVSNEANRRALGDYAVVNRGVATGANWFFVVTDEVRHAQKLPATVLRPMLRRLRDYTGEVLTPEGLDELAARDRRWLLVAPPRKNRNAATASYVALGERADVHRGQLCSLRPTWYDLSAEVHIPDVIVGPSSKGAFRFVENHADSPITNNLYGLSWRPSVTMQTKKAILTWLRSEGGQEAIERVARSQGSGLLKVEPRALARVLLPDGLIGAAAGPD